MVTRAVKSRRFVGTFVLVFFAVGSAVFGIEKIGRCGGTWPWHGAPRAGLAIGPISGCHVNPAVTLGVFLRGGVTAAEAAGYVVAQFLGGIAGAAVLKLFVSGFGGATDQTGSLGTNNWGENVTMGGAFLLEIILTFLLVFVILLVTSRAAAPGFAGLAIGLALAAIHMVGIPLDGTSVNPARSLGPALFEGGTALTTSGCSSWRRSSEGRSRRSSHRSCRARHWRPRRRWRRRPSRSRRDPRLGTLFARAPGSAAGRSRGRLPR